MSAKTYYTLEEAAKMLKLHPQTLRRWIRAGKLPARRFGKQFRLRIEDIEGAAQSALYESAVRPFDRSTLRQSSGLTAQGSRQEELSGFDQTALSALADLWDNEEDAIYDNWKELYNVDEG